MRKKSIKIIKEGLEITNQEIKVKQWEEVKKEILSSIPKKYKIEVEGLDADDKYFHPIIKIEDDIIIKGQGDIDINKSAGIYAWRLQIKQHVGCYIKTVEFDIKNLDHLNKVLSRWDTYKDKIKQYLELCKTINENIEMLEDIKRNIEGSLLFDIFEQEKRKKCLDNLFTVKEWIENERIIENYSGIN